MACILIIEDEAPIRANLVRFVALEGHQAIEAADGHAGYIAATTQRPDLILCDLMMPRMSGLEVLAALQLEPELRRVPLVFLSASAEPERMEEAARLGARGYLTKPFGIAELRAVLIRHLPGPADATSTA